MNYRLIIFMLCLSLGNVFAQQKHEIGLFFGGTNTIADVGANLPVNPNDVVVGAVYRWNQNSRFAFRAGLNYGHIKGNDLLSNDKERRARGINFRNTIREVNAGIEYNFRPFNLHANHQAFTAMTPYVHTGLAFFHYDALYLKGGKSVQKYNSHSTFAIPLTFGVKTTLSRTVVLGFEVGARYTFTDDLDGSNPVRDKKPYESLKFGNTKNNDWYVFTGITLTFAFGEKPCFCPGDK